MDTSANIIPVSSKQGLRSSYRTDYFVFEKFDQNLSF